MNTSTKNINFQRSAQSKSTVRRGAFYKHFLMASVYGVMTCSSLFAVHNIITIDAEDLKSIQKLHSQAPRRPMAQYLVDRITPDDFEDGESLKISWKTIPDLNLTNEFIRNLPPGVGNRPLELDFSNCNLPALGHDKMLRFRTLLGNEWIRNNLISLNLSNCQLYGNDVGYFTEALNGLAMPRLRQLDLSSNPLSIDRGGEDHLRGFRSLNEILEANTNLTTLNLANVGLKAEGLREIGGSLRQLIGLQTMKVSSHGEGLGERVINPAISRGIPNQFDAEAVELFVQNLRTTQLRELNVDGVINIENAAGVGQRVSQLFHGLLTRNPHIETFIAGGVPFVTFPSVEPTDENPSPDHISVLPELRELRTLTGSRPLSGNLLINTLANTRVANARALLPNLEVLSLKIIDPDTSWAEGFVGLASLREFEIDVDGAHRGEQSEALARAFGHLVNLRSLKAKNVLLNDNSLRIFTESFSRLEHLEDATLSLGNGCTDRPAGLEQHTYANQLKDFWKSLANVPHLRRAALEGLGNKKLAVETFVSRLITKPENQLVALSLQGESLPSNNEIYFTNLQDLVREVLTLEELKVKKWLDPRRTCDHHTVPIRAGEDAKIIGFIRNLSEAPQLKLLSIEGVTWGDGVNNGSSLILPAALNRLTQLKHLEIENLTVQPTVQLPYSLGLGVMTRLNTLKLNHLHMYNLPNFLVNLIGQGITLPTLKELSIDLIHPLATFPAPPTVPSTATDHQAALTLIATQNQQAYGAGRIPSPLLPALDGAAGMFNFLSAGENLEKLEITCHASFGPKAFADLCSNISTKLSNLRYLTLPGVILEDETQKNNDTQIILSVIAEKNKEAETRFKEVLAKFSSSETLESITIPPRTPTSLLLYHWAGAYSLALGTSPFTISDGRISRSSLTHPSN
jgi:hypothetical protein